MNTLATLAQRRAAMALKWKDKDYGGKNEGDVVSGFPMLIRTGGLLPALAYAVETKENKDKKEGPPIRKNMGEFTIASALVEHLSAERIATRSDSPEKLLAELAAGDASQLRRATAEALAFLNYLKRFVR